MEEKNIFPTGGLYPLFPCRTGGYGIVLPLFYIDSSLHLAELVDRVVTTFRPYRCYFVCSKKFGKAAYYYHFINFAALTLMLLGWYFIPQHLNSAFIPLVASIWVRSGWGVYRKIWRIG